MRRALPFIAAVILTGAGLYLGHEREERTAAQITRLQRDNTAMAADVAKWKDIALRFEALNRDCLSIAFPLVSSVPCRPRETGPQCQVRMGDDFEVIQRTDGTIIAEVKP